MRTDASRKGHSRFPRPMGFAFRQALEPIAGLEIVVKITDNFAVTLSLTSRLANGHWPRA